VFPVEPEGKRPLVKNWPSKATTDPEKIARWWRRWPDANVAGVTGPASGLLVVDIDNPAGLEALEGEYGKLPANTTTATGSGGTHIFYRYPDDGPEIRNSASKLAPGLDVRAAGGYVLLPPSRTTRPYTWLDRGELANAPAWLLRRLTEAHRPSRGESNESPPRPGPMRPGEPIAQGQRNDEMFRLACQLRVRGLELAEILAELVEINDARCVPPLDPGELAKIAESAARYEKGKADAGGPDSDTLEALAGVERELWGRSWSGMGELSSRDVLVSLIKLAREHGEKVAAGVRVSVSVRDLALMAAVSKPTAIRAYRRLVAGGLIRKDDAGRKEKEAGGFILLASRAELYHSDHQEGYYEKEKVCGKGLRAPLSAARLRWSGPRFDRVGDEIIRTTVRRLGKGAGAVVDALERAGGSATVEDLAHALQKTRPRDLRRRVVGRLVAAGVAECSGDVVELVSSWPEALEREREITEETAAFRRDVARYGREREAYANRHKIKAEPVPEKPPAGTIDELEPVEDRDVDLELLAALDEFLRLNPHGRKEGASWLGVAVWADFGLERKPTPDQVSAALELLPAEVAT